MEPHAHPFIYNIYIQAKLKDPISRNYAVTAYTTILNELLVMFVLLNSELCNEKKIVIVKIIHKNDLFLEPKFYLFLYLMIY